MKWTARSITVVGAALAITCGTIAPSMAADAATVAQEAIADLTASLPALTPVQGAGLAADVPECDGAKEADALAAANQEVRQAYGGSGGGALGRIVIFESAKDAKRFFKLVTSDDAEACIVATNGAGFGGGETTADLERGTLAGVKKSKTLEGTITNGDFTITEFDVAVRRGKVVLQAVVGQLPSGGDLVGIMSDWVVRTADEL